MAAARLPRVTAVIQIGQMEDFLQALPALAPVRIEHTAAETRILPR